MEKQDRQYVNAEGKFLATVKRPGNGWMGMEASGSEFVRVPLLIADEGEQKGREIVWKGYLTEKARMRTLQTLDDLFGQNWTFETLAMGQVDWAGKEVRVTVAGEEYNGETRYKAKWLNPSAPAAAKVEPAAVGKLDAVLQDIRKGLAAAFAPAKGADDIPF